MSGDNNIQSLHDICWRDVTDSDLPIFFEQELDEEANYMAAFTSKDPADEEAFRGHVTKIKKDVGVTIKTIQFERRVAGHIASFERFDLPEVSYWIGKEFWGNCIATIALNEFLNQLSVRPLYARVASDNIASIRVLEKCRFKLSGEDKAFANARGKEIEEFIMKLDP